MDKPIAKLSTDFHDVRSSNILCVFSTAYFPMCNMIESLVNLPIRNQGITYLALILDIPAPKKSGVVGSGNNE